MFGDFLTSFLKNALSRMDIVAGKKALIYYLGQEKAQKRENKEIGALKWKQDSDKLIKS